ncbi:GGDEF domain-containing protein [Butyrivibrio sp. CB08]|uniref:diguanylate cyclase n=1 Tax=Butyrivibrio sp. CB08 TaxID=2364879 RepID=UPI000EA9EF4A|nr:GGDEF domain-containing protein [Butyrivibrio sp. CB08]RKM61435.1 GGDEF domain-containing protein [Butyrivibrio sp. CB08]
MTNKNKLIAFMGGMIDEEKNSNFIREMEEGCRENGYIMLVFGFSETSFWNQDRNNCEMKLIEIASHLDLSAIIMQLEFIKNEYLIKAIMSLGQKKGIPIIAMEKETKGCINISMRYKDGFADMVRHVIDVHGCRKINMVAGFEGDHFSDERIEAYKQVLEEKGIPFEEKRLGYGNFWDRPARDVANRFIESGDIPEAIVCANDNMAIAVTDELQKHGFRVPEDVIVTGFDGIKKCLFKKPSVTTVEPDYKGEARRLLEIIKQNEGHPDSEGFSDISFQLKLRDTCGCRRSQDSLSPDDVSGLFDSYEDVNWAVTSINELFAQTAHLESLKDLPGVIKESMWIWERDFQFGCVYSDLLRPEIPDIGNKEYTTLYSFRNNVSTNIGESFDAEEFLPDFDAIVESNNICVMIVKLLHSGNHIFGYIVEGTPHTTNRDIRRFEELGMTLSTAINNAVVNRDLANMRQEIEQISVLDYLTGIYNRRGFFSELDRLINIPFNRDRYLTVFSIDMDGLKYINDFYGHAEGDFAIQCVAGAVHHIVNRNGICARYGGDEFACALITDYPIDLSPDVFRSRMDNVLLAREDITEKEYVITASVGSACAPIDHKLNLEKLLSEADEKMYEDKKLKSKGKVRMTQ